MARQQHLENQRKLKLEAEENNKLNSNLEGANNPMQSTTSEGANHEKAK